MNAPVDGRAARLGEVTVQQLPDGRSIRYEGVYRSATPAGSRSLACTQYSRLAPSGLVIVPSSSRRTKNHSVLASGSPPRTGFGPPNRRDPLRVLEPDATPGLEHVSQPALPDDRFAILGGETLTGCPDRAQHVVAILQVHCIRMHPVRS